MELYSKHGRTSAQYNDFKTAIFVKLLQKKFKNLNCFNALLIILEIYVLKVELQSNIIPTFILFETIGSLKLEI